VTRSTLGNQRPIIVGVTPARGGSKGVPRKNIRPICEKPLIAWTIEAAKSSRFLSRYVVSTEDAEISEVVRKYGAEVIARLPSLATDEATTLSVLQHVLEEVPADIIVLLQATSPVRDADLIDRCIQRFLDSGADSLATGFICKYVEYGKNESRRQDIPGFFYDDGNVYVIKADLLRKGDRFGQRIERILLDPEQSVEIDNEFDFWLAEQVLRRRQGLIQTKPLMIQRTHDKQVYLAQDRYEKPKELSKLLMSLVRQSGGLRPGEVVGDVGCAAGEFLYYLRQQFPSARYHGFDVVPELIDKARTKVPGVEFEVNSVLEKSLMPAASLDVCFLVGVLPIFDEFEPTFENLLHWTKPGGRIYVATLLNPYPMDVWVTYRLADDPIHEHRETGWNMFSKRSVSRYLDTAVGSGKYTFTRFEMPFDLPPDPKDPVRTWTFLDREGRRLITNGLSLICNMEVLEIRP